MAQLTEKARLMDAQDLNRVIRRIASEIVEHNKGTDNMILVGIHRRGVYLARRIQKMIEDDEHVKVPCGELDITLYRDDLTTLFEQPMVHSTRMPEDISGKAIFLVDDVIYTGRTVRAGMDALLDHGRPKRVWLAVLVDRGGRELPIQGDFVGLKLDVAMHQRVSVRMKDVDGEDAVLLESRS